jgi:hypothetical protein
MEKQIENINWLGKDTISQHDQFFDDMGHGPDWRNKH